VADTEMPSTKPKYENSENLIQDLYFGVAEQTVTESPYHADSLERPYNPDALFKKSGDYSIYEDMLSDDQVSVCMQLKKDLVIGSGWDIIPGDEGQEEIVEDIKIALKEDPSVSFDDSLEEILSAYEFGFSLTEKIFKHRGDGSLTLAALKTRHPSTWLIHTDKKGNISRYQQYADTDLTVEPKSLIHYVNNRKFQNPYGKSDLRPAYAAWFTKRQIIKYFAIFLEKAASPTPIAKYDKNAPPAAITDIFNALKAFQTKTALAIPKDIEVEFLEASNKGEVYERAINIFNTFIGRSMFIPDLLGFSGGQTSGGSLALGKEQMQFFIKHIQRRRKVLEDMVNNEIIWSIVFYNWGFVDNYPRFKLQPVNEMDAVEFAKIWLEAVKGRVYKPSDAEINYFRSLLKFPEGDVDEFEQAANPLMAQGNPAAPEKEKEEKETEEPEEEKKTFALGPVPPGEYHKKCDFKMIKRQLESYDEALLRDAEPVINEIFEDLYDQIQRKRIIQTGNAEKIDSIKLKKLGTLKQLLKKSMRDVFSDGGRVASSELLRGTFAKTTVLPTDEFLEVLETELFQFIGDWEYTVTKKARTEIIAAIKDGNPLSSVINIMDLDGKKLSMVQLERYARTKHTEVFNKGRLDFFEDSGVVSAYQYSAILDAVTSEICAGLDGKIFKAGDQPIPPMHFNCRSLLIPITKYEEWDADTKAGGKPIDKFIEENKGAGFATQ
jgi:SPP1 gp7 family putative phage head morphogenesis protein